MKFSHKCMSKSFKNAFIIKYVFAKKRGLDPLYFTCNEDEPFYSQNFILRHLMVYIMSYSEYMLPSHLKFLNDVRLKKIK